MTSRDRHDPPTPTTQMDPLRGFTEGPRPTPGWGKGPRFPDPTTTPEELPPSGVSPTTQVRTDRFHPGQWEKHRNLDSKTVSETDVYTHRSQWTRGEGPVTGSWSRDSGTDRVTEVGMEGVGESTTSTVRLLVRPNPHPSPLRPRVPPTNLIRPDSTPTLTGNSRVLRVPKDRNKNERTRYQRLCLCVCPGVCPVRPSGPQMA